MESKLLKDYTDEEKGAYIGAIASIATIDRKASNEELEFLRALADAADLSEAQEDAVVRAATELSDEELKRCIEILSKSDLRFSFLTDIISFANADGAYTPDEKAAIEEMARDLNVNQQQFSLLDLFVKKSNDSAKSPEQITQPGFLESLGLKDKLNQAGINSNSLTKGLIGILGPMVVAKLLTGALTGRRKYNTGLLNTRRPSAGFGGMGSLISLLSGGRGYPGMKNITPRLFGPANAPRRF